MFSELGIDELRCLGRLSFDPGRPCLDQGWGELAGSLDKSMCAGVLAVGICE